MLYLNDIELVATLNKRDIKPFEIISEYVSVTKIRNKCYPTEKTPLVRLI